MKILFVHGDNREEISPFIQEQIYSLEMAGIVIDVFGIQGKGLIGYYLNRSKLRQKINQIHPILIHAHYGFSGLLAVLASRKPTIITFHGTDISDWRARPFSIFAMLFSRANIFVGKSLQDRLFFKFRSNSYVIPCGIDISTFRQTEVKRVVENDHQEIKILFASAFDNKIKNFPLAKEAISLIEVKVEIIELKNKSREEVAALINQVDLLLLTSFSEGSPQVIKEAMSCNCPIVSTKVGDVEFLLKDIEGCFVTEFDPKDVASKIKLAANYRRKMGFTKGRDRILELKLDNQNVAKRIIEVYNNVIKHE